LVYGLVIRTTGQTTLGLGYQLSTALEYAITLEPLSTGNQDYLFVIVNQFRKVKVVPYNSAWPDAFNTEAETIKHILGAIIADIHHIGSTSMPGAAAKPIIDIIPVVTDIAAVDAFNDRLAAIGYVAKGEYGIPGRRFFIKDTAGERSQHLHIFQQGSLEITRHLALRDYLIAHPDELDAYCRLKTGLARQHENDIEAYMDGKDSFIKEIDRKAAAWK
jgi:GrpB-like predicted nucleotidyltransferase (UPF0157 family)